ncbi:DUF1566 domain-containing protein [Pseudodesulfovibrio sp. S3]|uniref:Lcl C-terminal domain-containing protein n=2 Tax=unclassified Pseudodesulfovibrio TaxID=2661612 RepID=UPI0013E349AD|nr:DUF1566 domain-containing protein [Pseudodesulfovibrio sp. S3]MCJ2164444.1 DUF1566 domain-containing protein [Pseudodesulfovibrio sp. S3-i]
MADKKTGGIMRIISLKDTRLIAQVVLLCVAMLVVSAGAGFAESFVDNNDGTVTDTMSGLMWSKKPAPGGPVQWEQAKSIASSSSFGGKGGWRVPTKEELEELYSHLNSGSNPFDMGFPSSIPHWSSTAYDRGFCDGCQYFVDMHSGKVEVHRPVGIYSYVWPVRSGN